MREVRDVVWVTADAMGTARPESSTFFWSAVTRRLLLDRKLQHIYRANDERHVQAFEPEQIENIGGPHLLGTCGLLLSLEPEALMALLRS